MWPRIKARIIAVIIKILIRLSFFIFVAISIDIMQVL